MTTKKKYAVGDIVWIYGISHNNYKSTQGTVLKTFVIDYQGFNDEVHYVIGIPTEIETLLEIRTWHTISQTQDGRVGGIREAFSDDDASRKLLRRAGMDIVTDDTLVGSEDDPSADVIHAALEKSQKDGEHGPFVVKPPVHYKRKSFKKTKT